MLVAHRPTPELPRHLEALYRAFPFERSLAQDPLSCVRPLARGPRGAEIAGIFAATLAIGNTTAIRRAFDELARRTGGDIARWLAERSSAERARDLRGFRHRWIRGDQLAFLADRLADVYALEGSLEDTFLRGARGPGGFAGGLDALARALRGDVGANPARGGRHRSPPRGYVALFPSPLDRGRSPCKRLALFVRWMTRTGYPDLGVWTRVPAETLRVPLDLHVHWIAYNLGLTQRRSRSWATVEEVTAALRAIDPEDPVKYDFVLCHTGISGDCPKSRDAAICAPCAVRPDCRLWRGVRGTGG